MAIDEKSVTELLGMTPEELEEEIRRFENDTWDPSEYGEPRFGRPLLFEEPMKPVTFKETPTVIAKMDDRAKSQGKSRSDYLRSLVAADLALV